MRNCEHLIDLKTEQYWANEERIWKVLNSMTTREIACHLLELLHRRPALEEIRCTSTGKHIAILWNAAEKRLNECS